MCHLPAHGQDDEHEDYDIVHEESLDVPRRKRSPTLEESKEEVAANAEVRAEAPGGGLEGKDVDGDVLGFESHAEADVVERDEAP